MVGERHITRDMSSSSSWAKAINHAEEPLLSDFPLHVHFKKVADIIRTPTPPSGKKAKQTVIFFQPCIAKKEWSAKGEQWVYIITVDGHVVKIGGTRSGLAGRVGSYLCGHHTAGRGKSGKCSVTNAHIYDTLDKYIEFGHVAELFASKILTPKITMDVWGQQVEITAQIYTHYETAALEAYKSVVGHYPPLSDNSDPSARKK
jgi:hypothetical protein